MPKSEMSSQVAQLAAEFVEAKRGLWDHQEWEFLVEKVQSLGLLPNEETTRHLGNILEGLKYFYTVNPSPALNAEPSGAVARAKTAAKPKPEAKPKSAAKAEAKPRPEPKAKAAAKPKAKTKPKP